MRFTFCLSATLLLHWLLLQPLLLGSSTVKRSPHEDFGPGASSTSSDDGEWMTLVFVNSPESGESSPVVDVSSLGAALADSLIQITSPDSAPLLEPEQFAEDEESAEAVHTAGDPAIQSLLFGRYTAQINARIQRAWRKPRSPVTESVQTASGSVHSSDAFRCQARISQDASGNVTEIELLQCDGSTAWQLSLVRAIQRSSPLPAPPSPTVFTNALTLAFEAESFVPGYREDEYEVQTVRSAQTGFAR
jgi:hypothetical protein